VAIEIYTQNKSPNLFIHTKQRLKKEAKENFYLALGANRTIKKYH